MAIFVWSGTGAWTDNPRWSLGSVPGAGGLVQIGSGSASVNDTRSIAAIDFSGGIITGAGDLTLNSGVSLWTNGSLTGTGIFRVGAGATLDLTGAAHKVYSRSDGNSSGGRTIRNAGTFNLGGTGNLIGADGGQIINETGGLFVIQSNVSLTHNGVGNAPTFSNAGTLRKSGSSGTSTFSGVGFTNTGLVEVATGGGTLAFAAGVVSNAGTFTAAAGTSITFAGGQVFNTGTSLTGNIRLLAGDTTVSGAIAANGLEFGDGNLLGTAAITGSLNWTGGSWVGTGTLTINSGSTLNISGTAQKFFQRSDGNSSGGRTIANLGDIFWTGTGTLRGGDGAQILNQAGGRFFIQNDVSLSHSGNGVVPSFSNAGLVRKNTSTGTSTIAIPFTNSGTVDVQTGTLAFTSSVTSNAGTFTAGNGTTLDFSGGQTFNSGTALTGSGTGAISLTGLTTVAGAFSTQNVTFTSGTLQGSATLSGALAWAGGSWSGTGTLTVDPSATLTLATGSAKIFNRNDGNSSGGRTITNQGDIIWTGGPLQGGDGAQIINQATGEFFMRTDSSFGHTGFGNLPTFTNSGLLRKDTTSGTTTFAVPFVASDGTVNVQTGTLAFTNSVLSSFGTFTVAPTATLTFSSGQNFQHGTTLGGGGSIRILSGDTTISGSITANGVEFAGGNLLGNADVSGTVDWTGGTWRNASTITFQAGSTLTISGTNAKNIIRGDGNSTGGRVLQTSGLMRWQDAGGLLGADGAGISVLSGGVFEIRNDASYAHNGAGVIPFLNNTGTIRKLASSGTTNLTSVSFTNQGLLEVQTGTLALTGFGGLSNQGTLDISNGATLVSSAAGQTSSGGSFNVSPGGLLRFTGGTNTIDTSSFTGQGLTEVAGGTLLVSASDLSGQFRLSSGTIGGAGIFAVTTGGRFNWNGGNLSGTGSLLVNATGELVIDGAGSKSFFRGDGNSTGGRTISNFGNVTWADAGSILGGDGAQFVNQAGAFFTITGDALFSHTGAGANPVFTNSGTVRKNAGIGVSEFAREFTNNGVVESNSGTVRLSGGGAGNGQFRATGGEIAISNGYTLNNGARFTGSSYSRLTGATLSISNLALASIGSPTAIGRFALDGGILGGAGTLLVDALGRMDWNGGTIQGTGVLRVASGGELRLLNAINHDFSRADGNSTGGRTIENFGTILWSAGTLRGGDGAQLLNQAGGVFEVSGGSSFAHTGAGATPSFTNNGTFRKNGAGLTTVGGTAFTTSGLVDVQLGDLTFLSGVTSHAGHFNAGASSTLLFNGGQTFNHGTNFSGPGVMRLGGGNTILNGTITASYLYFSGGSLNGTATLAGMLEWDGGDLRGPGTLTISSGAHLITSGNGHRDFFRGDGNSTGGRVIENFGSILVDNAGDLRGGDGAQIINRSAGIFALQNDRGLGHTGAGAAPTFTNEGTFMKFVGAGVSTVTMPFTNTGHISVTSGTLSFASTFTNTNGQISVTSGAHLAFAGPLNLGTGALFGDGSLLAAGGVTTNGPVFAQQLAITGDLTLLGSSFLTLEINGVTPALTVNGNGALGGHLGLVFASGLNQTLLPSGTFTLVTANSPLTGAFANVANGQRITVLGGAGTFQVNYGVGSAFAANSLVLSNFQVIPEPSTYALLGLGALVIVARLRRRR